jgi:5-methylcytosine-specific restriction endonuclease McrA
MIHSVRLPRKNRIHLSQVVRVQTDLLLAAAYQTGDIDRASFGSSLDGVSNRTERNQRLLHWLFVSTSKPREHLQNFINGTDGQEFLENHAALQAEKIKLVKMMRCDVGRLYTNDCTETFDFYMLDDDIPGELPGTRQYVLGNQGNKRYHTHFPDWLRAAKDFFIYFYENLSDTGLSEELFCNNSRFSRDDFFFEYEQANPSQYVCAICDEHDFMTILRGDYHSDIEHYFPKDVYPHLACHPRNLIPLCGPCNTAHLNKDPLKNKDRSRRHLNSIFLPYHGGSIQDIGALKFAWSSNVAQEKQIEFTTPDKLELKIQNRNDLDPDFEGKLAAFAQIYDIPRRWENRIHQIGDQMWRYIHHFLMAEFKNDEGFSNPDFIQFKMNQLMSYLFEDLGKSPWTFVILWWLGNSVIHEIEKIRKSDGSFEESPLLLTIQDMAAMDSKIRKINQEKTYDLLEVIRKFSP